MLAHEAIIFYDHDSYNILYNICTNQCSALSIFIMHQFCNINEYISNEILLCRDRDKLHKRAVVSP